MSETQVGTRDFWDFPPQHVLRWTPEAFEAFLPRLGWRVGRVVEEPLSVVGASSEIACSQAMWNGYLHSPIRRRAAILLTRLRLLATYRRWSGVSLYVEAEKI